MARLVACGAEVEVLGPIPIKRREVRALLEDHAVRCSPRALLDRSELVAALRRCDSLVHLNYRAPTHWSPGTRLAGEALTNLLPSIRLLAAASSAGIGHVCFASSTAVYSPPAHGVSEDAAVGGPVSPYALCKIAQEAWVSHWSLLNGRPTTVLRLATVYGAGETVDRAIPNFIRAVVHGHAPTVEGDGREPFDPVHVRDVADAFVRALDARAHGTYNIGTGMTHTPREVAELVVRLCGADWAVAENNLAPARAVPTCDVSRAALAFGFSARTPLIMGLEEEIAWFRGVGETEEVGVRTAP